MLEEMKQLVKQKNICVLSTIAANKPYCSLMAYAANGACPLPPGRSGGI